MRFKKVLTVFLALLMIVVTAACQKPGVENTGSSDGKSNGKVSFEFWSAPNPTQAAFWKKMAKNYMKSHENVSIKVTPMPETPSSEAGIQTALASGTAPAISENISRSFGSQLATSQAIVPLESFDQFSEIIKGRHMDKTIKGWKFSDGHQYVIPLYSNAMLFGWRMDILNKLGFDEPPKTYSEVLKVGKKLKQKYPDKYLWARPDFVKPTWWARWFDFFMIYNAASNGNAFIKGDKLVADDEAGKKTLKFFDKLAENDLLLSQEATDPFASGLSIWQDVGPWTFPTWKEKFPKFKLGEEFVLAMPPVPDNMDPSKAKTFADTKGLVVYASATKAQQQAAMDFVKWVLTEPEHDLTWFKMTNLPPARDDLSTNTVFADFLKKHPALQEYAKNIPNAIPPIDNKKVVDLQTILSKEAFNPVIQQDKEPEKAWKDMKEKLRGVLGNG